MENQRNSTINPILINTSRQFYSRRIAQRTNSNAQVDKILKIMTQLNQKKPPSRIKTQHKEQNQNAIQIEIDNMLKITKIKLQNLIKKQRGPWRQFYDLIDQFKRSSSLQSLKMNQINLLLKMQEIMKITIKQQQNSTERYRTKEGANKMKQCKLSLETIKIYKQNQILKEQLQNLQCKQKKNENEKNICSSKQHVLFEIEETTRRISQKEYAELTREVQQLKQGISLLRNQKKSLIQKNFELKATNQNLCEQILRSRDNSSCQTHKLQIWKNIMGMQNQEIITLKRDIVDIKREFQDLHLKYQSTLKRMNKFNSNSQGKLNQITGKALEVFTEQVQSFQRIRNLFAIRGFYPIIETFKDQKDCTTTATYKRYLSQKDSLNNPEGIKKMSKDYYRFYKPSFFVYLQKYFEYQGVGKENFQQINMVVNMHLLATLRGILDSKHNEYLMATNISKQFTSLSTFTLSWLCNYKIDSKTRKQQQICSDICFQTIGSFYAQLMSNQLNGNWEVITFREFLLQTLTIDELTFYLKARFKLMKGDCLVGSGAFLQICYVNYLDALLLIQELVTDFDYRKKLEQYIKRSVQIQGKKQLIDAHFILRLLLQFYQCHKNKIFTTLFKTFANFTKQKKSNMQFQFYLKIYDYNFFQISLIDKVQIFQKAFSLGRGVVYLENIFTVLNQQGYLYGQVIKMFTKHAVYEQSLDQITNPAQRIEPIDHFQSFYQNFDQNILAKESSNLGLQTIKMSANQLRISKNLSYEKIISRLQFLHKISMLRLKKMFDTKKIKQNDFAVMISPHQNFYQQFIKSTIERSEILMILQDFKKKNAARAIMKFYRKKKGFCTKNFLLSIQNIDKNTDKLEQIRKEFTSIIDVVKNKYSSPNIQQNFSQYQETKCI